MFGNDIITEIQSAKKGQEISKSVRNFSVTLHFYSPRAYQFVRQAFSNRLPHPRTILRWYSSVDGSLNLLVFLNKIINLFSYI